MHEREALSQRTRSTMKTDNEKVAEALMIVLGTICCLVTGMTVLAIAVTVYKWVS